MQRSGFDPRVWLVWGAVASLPPIMGRNPFPIAACLIVTLTVRATAPGDRGWGSLLKLATLFAVIGVLFNLLTYHGGDRVVASIPAWMPIVGGPLTLNAIVYGALSGLALVTLVVIWSTVAQRIVWADLVRIMPASLAPMMVAGAVAMALIPRTVDAYGEIREAQALRGYRPRGARDIAPLAAPLLTQGLERAITLSEALESRGFGGPPSANRWAARFALGLILALTGIAAGAFLVSTGASVGGLVLLSVSAGGFVVLLRGKATSTAFRSTRYRDLQIRRRDWLVFGSALGTAAVLLAANSINPATLHYEPYPEISWPTVNLLVLAAIALLMVPAFVTPLPESHE